jgi:hypothetical protein
MDYIWREAVRRNAWILQQGGERVKIFIRKVTGVPCNCQMDEETVEYSKQPSQRCLQCYGTGFLSGFEGPFDTIIAPDDGEHRVSQTPYGRRQENTYEVFMGPSPVVTMRDFIVKQTNERYSIGAVRRPTNRGNLLQQHFTIGSFDSGDIRYAVPVDGTASLPWPQTRYTPPDLPSLPNDGSLPDTIPYPEGPTAINPMETENGSIPDASEQRGRTPVWGNISRNP